MRILFFPRLQLFEQLLSNIVQLLHLILILRQLSIVVVALVGQLSNLHLVALAIEGLTLGVFELHSERLDLFRKAFNFHCLEDHNEWKLVG